MSEICKPILVTVLRVFLVGSILLTTSPVYAQTASPSNIELSPAWPACKPDVMTIDSIIKAIPCVAKTDPAGARKILDYMMSPAGIQARMRLAEQQAGGDENATASLLGQWDGEIDSVNIEVREMAQPKIAATLFNYPHAPVKLTDCGLRHALDDPQWQINASWQPLNVALTAVKIRIQTQDAFGTTLQTDDLAPTGHYDSNVIATDSWTVGDTHMPAQANVSRVRCSIIGAIFADGRIWAAAKSHTDKAR